MQNAFFETDHKFFYFYFFLCTEVIIIFIANSILIGCLFRQQFVPTTTMEGATAAAGLPDVRAREGAAAGAVTPPPAEVATATPTATTVASHGEREPHSHTSSSCHWRTNSSTRGT